MAKGELDASSSLRVPYNIRPAKQAERRMLLELYQRISGLGFPIDKYHYVGFGAVFFIDFRLIHKMLGIYKMTSIEGFGKLWKRCEFNLPFGVTLFKGLSSGFIPKIDRDERYLVWFDYDFPMGSIVAGDIAGLTSSLRADSLLFVTIDLEGPEDLRGASTKMLFDYYTNELPSFAMAGMSEADFKPPKRDATIVRMVERCINQGLVGRNGLSFEYLIRLAYADGRRMLTVGGMIVDGASKPRVSGEQLADIWFLSRGEQGAVVDIPRLVFTDKEVAALERWMPTGAGVPKNMGLTADEVDRFRRFYRYWPSYSEALV